MPNIIINTELHQLDIDTLNNQHKNVILMYFYKENNDFLQNNVISNLISDMICNCTIIKIKITEMTSFYLDQSTTIQYNKKHKKHKNNIISNEYGEYVYNGKEITINKFNFNNIKDLLNKISKHHSKNTKIFQNEIEI
jgi:hypothetical protein